MGNNMNFSKEEVKLLVELISNEQIHMIKKDHKKHTINKYKQLEQLKVKIKTFNENYGWLSDDYVDDVMDML